MEKKKDWRIVSVIPDYSSKRIYSHFKEKVNGLQKAEVLISDEMNKSDLSSEIASEVGYSEKRTLALYGSGSYHHITYGLCRIAHDISNKFTYIHIDNHSDFGDSQNLLDCGSFVKNILEDKYAKSLILVGCSHNSASTCIDKFDFRKFGHNVMDKILRHTKTEDVYISIDLDVMDEGEVSTSLLYSRGTMRKDRLLEIIEGVKSSKRIISADILGYTTSMFPSMNRKSKALYEDISRAIIGSDEWAMHITT